MSSVTNSSVRVRTLPLLAAMTGAWVSTTASEFEKSVIKRSGTLGDATRNPLWLGMSPLDQLLANFGVACAEALHKILNRFSRVHGRPPYAGSIPGALQFGRNGALWRAC